MLQEFTCKCYGSKNTRDIKVLRRLLFCAKKVKYSCINYPHAKTVHENSIRKNCLSSCPVIPSPVENGRIRDDQSKLSIDWMRKYLATDAVLELLSCHCSCLCNLKLCSCLFNELGCTDMCRLDDCTKQANFR